MATIRSFEEPENWNEARRLCQKVIALKGKEVVSKDCRFRNNMQETAGSVMDNIAEGFERDSRLAFVNALSYSKGSIGEVRTRLFRGFSEGYLGPYNLGEMNNEYKVFASHVANFIKYLHTGGKKD